MVAEAIGHCAVANEAVHEPHIKRAVAFPASAAEPSDGFRRHTLNSGQALDPKYQELVAIHENQGIDTLLSDESCRQDGLAECGGGGQDAGVVCQCRFQKCPRIGMRLELLIQKRRIAALARWLPQRQ